MRFSIKSLVSYLPLLMLIVFSGNPLLSLESNAKILLTSYTTLWALYVFTLFKWNVKKYFINKFLTLFFFILILIIFQISLLGSVSIAGVIGFILKMMLAFTTILYYYKKKINFFHTYIKLMKFLVIVGLPFWILNHFGHYGLAFKDIYWRTFIVYTSYPQTGGFFEIRNSGMFWEPGAFAGYLALALIFITYINGKFSIGIYNKEVIWIIVGILSTTSTTGYLVLALFIIVYFLQNFTWQRIFLVPASILIIIWGFLSLEFINTKLEEQFYNAQLLSKYDISNSRFGALKMDMQYIRSQPLIGNGLGVKTRYRFHTQVTEDIGHGNGMSNFIAYWGIPFFLIWLYNVYKVGYHESRSKTTSWLTLLIIVLLLQGEQFLNYPLFISFFFFARGRNFNKHYQNLSTNLPFLNESTLDNK